MLAVKVAEISRTELKRLNANFNALYIGGDGTIGGTNGGGVMNAVGEFLPNPMRIISQGFFGTFVSEDFRFNMALDAAKENGLAKILAEPTLTTLTGQEAEFLSGGEFPIPVPQGTNGAVTIEFKPYGVGLKFLPVVLSDGRINLKVNVSVSEITDTSSLVLENENSSLRTFVPSLRQRSASATVELGDGQSMGLAGLLDDNLRESVTKFPGLGSVPGAGYAVPQQPVPQGPDRAGHTRHAAPRQAGRAGQHQAAYGQVHRTERFGLLSLGPDRRHGEAVQRPSSEVKRNSS